MGCNPLSHFDAGQCALGLTGGFFDFLTGWVWGLPIWVILCIVVGVLWLAYRFGGLPGLAGAAVGIGVLIGRRSVAVGGREHAGGYVLTRDDILAVQRALKARGLYSGDLDGKWGPVTKTAVMHLQANLRPKPEIQTGTLTPRVLAALGIKLP